jgi:predicted transcriptional regulator
MSDKTKATPAPPEETPSTPLDIVDQAYQEALAQYELDRDADNVAALKDANAAYEAMLAEQRKGWIDEYIGKHWRREKNPHEGKSPAEVYRLTRPYDTRIEELLEAAKQCDDPNRTALLAQALLCCVYRNRNHVAITKAKTFLRPFMSVDGDNGDGLSPEFNNLLSNTPLKISYGEVVWVIGHEDVHEPDKGSSPRPGYYNPPQRAVLAHQEPKDASYVGDSTVPKEDY